MNSLLINPYIRHTMYSWLSPHHQINRRIILDYELIHINEGELLLIYNGHSQIYTKGDLLLLCPGIPHTFIVQENTLSQPHIHFDVQYDTLSQDVYICFQDFPDLTPQQQLLIRENAFPQLCNSPLITISNKATFLKTFYEIIDEPEKNSLKNRARMLLLLNSIILENAPDAISLPPEKEERIAPQIKAYLDSNYNQNISLDRLSSQYNYSKYYLEKLFKQKYGMSIISYRNKKRIEAANTLLKKESITQVAQHLGYSSVYAFSRAYYTQTGQRPSEISKRSAKK